MTAVGELIVLRVNGKPVIDRADKLILVTDELLAEIGVVDGVVHFGPVQYRVVGRSLEHPGSMLCERVA